MIDLVCHEDTPAASVRAIQVHAAMTGAGGLALSYTLCADRHHLAIPEASKPERVEGLWRHTCFEAFVMGADAPAYREFNFSPAGAWQAYVFEAYRRGGPMPQVTVPRILRDVKGPLTLHVLLPLPDLPPGPRLRLGLAAVIEASTGDLSYWALRHPPGRPDFHHSDGFALELARP